ncbi:hypothetical protein BMS3Bbin01_01917 [bacterium BMS3Bbin01]|nr:hypothetical protein BMS3Bbin01_01917 [bacterium BMS3Bbin01]
MAGYAVLMVVGAIVAAVSAPAPPARWERSAPVTTATGLPVAYAVPITFGDLGPRLVAAGVIDPERFTMATTGGRSLTADEQRILDGTFDGQFIVDASSAGFLLNFLWAAGLANDNPVLTSGRMASSGDIGRFAATGGWTVGTRPGTELYASIPLVTLSPTQQARLEAVADAVYRPCCDNPTSFPDCNHGMAMLGLLTVMASEDAPENAMLDAARWVSALWFPPQAAISGAYSDQADGQDWSSEDPAALLSRAQFSASGQRKVAAVLASLGVLPDAAGYGAGCSLG